jgi:hypothetical protein
MSQYDERGNVALWKPKSDNPKAPAASGTVVAHRDIREGETLDIALWRNDSDNPKAPLMKGKIRDRQERRQEPAGSASDDLGDDIPFSSEAA